MENKLKKYKIYSLRSYNDKSVIYYDYTSQFLHKRLSAIKSRYTRYLNNMDNYIVSFELFKLGNVYIELEEELECINREHLNAVLNKYIRDNDCLNKSYYDNKEKKDNDISKKQNQITLYKSTPYIEEIHKDIKDINTLKEPVTEPVTEPVKTPVKEPVKDKLQGLTTIQPPTINNIKRIDIKNNIDYTELEYLQQKYLYSNNDDNDSIKSLTSSVIKSNKNNQTKRIDFPLRSKTLKKKNFI